MSRIGPTLGGIELSLLNNLSEAQAGLALANLRISESKNVIAPWTDPSKFMAISGLETDLSLVTATMKNVTAADSLMTQTDSLMTQMLTQLDVIKTELETDVDQALTPAERLAAQEKIDTAIGEINRLASTAIDGRNMLDGSADYDISGVNSSQVDSFRVFKKNDVGQTQIAKGAEFTYAGTNRFATSDADVTIKGDGASLNLTITAGQTLESIAKEINDSSSSTQLEASVDGNALTIRGTVAGSDHSMSILTTSGSFAVTGESSQSSSTTTRAEFTYTGASGKITDDATFDVTGNTGTQSYAVTAGQDLSVVADAINADVLTTGVMAEVGSSGNTIVLSSATAGGDQFVNVTATSGSFEVSNTASSTTVAKTHGELTYTGAAGKIAANATFDIIGNLGTANFVVTTADDLTDVVDDINLETVNTGVYAVLDGDDINLYSSGEGSDQFAKVDVTAGTFIVAAGNSITDWGTTDSTTYGTTTNTTVGQNAAQSTVASIAGKILETGTQAALVYTGNAGDVQAGDEGDLTIVGSEGSATITIAASESLTDVATAINNQSYKTGVIAGVSGDELTIESVKAGSAQMVELTSTGTFLDNVTGGRGDGTAYGTDATAIINGFTYSPDTEAELRHRSAAGTLTSDATITITGRLGSANLSLTTGETMQQVADAINAETANTGVYALVDSNDLVLRSTDAGSDASVQLNVTSGTFDLVAGFDTDATAAELTYTGTGGDFNSYPVNFTLTGPDGAHVFNFIAGTSLADAATAINLETGTTGVTASTDGDDLIFRTVDKGSAVTMSIVGITVTGGDGAGNATGTDAVATDAGEEGQSPMGWMAGNTFNINQNGFHYQIDFAQGFEGDFSPIRVRDGGSLSFVLLPDERNPNVLGLPSLLAANLGGIDGSLNDLLSGGSVSGLDDNTSKALRIVEEAIGDVTLAQAQVSGLRTSSIDTASTYLSEQQTNLQNAIDETDGFNLETQEAWQSYYEQLISNTISSLSIVYSQRESITALLTQVAGLNGSNGY